MLRSRAATMAAAALALGAAPAVAQPGVNPRISPKHGHPHTVFRVGFTAPEPAGHDGVVERSYSVVLVVGNGRHCTQNAAQDVTQAAAGERVRLTFAVGGRWCLGRGRGTISRTEGPYCDADSGDPCPLFPTSSRAIARFGFRVR